jgi:hypothetical protein
MEATVNALEMISDKYSASTIINKKLLDAYNITLLGAFFFDLGHLGQQDSRLRDNKPTSTLH